jgi:iron complex outermembrane receptor protein
MESMTGVSQVGTGIGIGKPVIRGLRGNRVLVYTQDVRLENQQYGDEHGLGVPESMIEGIEVIKGPASLLYGSDALGGVVYFNPLKFTTGNSFRSYLDQSFYSNTHGTNTSLVIKKSYDKWKFIVNAAHIAHSDYKMGNSTRVSNTRFTEKVVGGAAGFSNDLLSTVLRLSTTQTKVGIPEEIGIQETNKTPLLPYQDLSTHIASLNTLFFFGKSKLATVFGFTQNIRKEFEDHHDHSTEQKDEIHIPAMNARLNSSSYNLKWHMPQMGDLETILGIQGMFQKNQNSGEEILIPDAETNDVGLYVTSFYQWKNTSLQGGLRFDSRSIKTAEYTDIHEGEIHHVPALKKKYNQFTASAGIKTLLPFDISTRLNLASGFRAPTIAELTSDGVHHGSLRFEKGNAVLKSERNLQLDLVLEHATDHIEFFVNGFYNKVFDYIYISPTGETEDDFPVFEYLQGDAQLYGSEFGFHLHPHPLDWLHIRSSYEMVIGELGTTSFLPLIPAHQWRTTLKTEFKSGKFLKNPFLSLSFNKTFDQNKISEFEESTSGYGLWNLSWGNTIKKKGVTLELSAHVNNIADKKYVSHLSRLKPSGMLNIGRNVMVKLNISI